jgi:deazaflavin-dependent oxidoreductase (nitroreductase family)
MRAATWQTAGVPLRSLVRRLGGRRWFAALGRAVVPADTLVSRLTGGRVIALGLAPSLLLTTTGRRSGQPRATPLVYAHDGHGFLVVGSNWGRPVQPAWALNLLADPSAEVRVAGRHLQVAARVLSGDERARAWKRLLAVWPAYDTYAQRAGGRPLHVFRLEPVTAA